MYRALLKAQWNSVAPALLILSLVAFGLPLVQMLASGIAGSNGNPEDAFGILSIQLQSSFLYPFIAYMIGTLLAVATWRDDMQGKHIYALSLPVPRWYYLLLRLGVGLTFVAGPALALWVAALITASQITLPTGLHAYPGGLMVRFALASAVAFTLTFAGGTISQKAQRVGLWIFVAVIVVLIGFAVAGVPGPIMRAIQAFLSWPSVVDTFTGRWLLIDV